MSSPIPPKAKVQRAVKVWVEQRGNFAAAARILKMPRTCVQVWIAKAEEWYGIKAKKPKQGAVTVKLVVPKGAGDTERAARDAERITELERGNRDLGKQLRQAQDVRASLFKLTSDIEPPPAWNFRPPAKGARTELLPLLFASDFQWGEKVVPGEIDGLNEYNPDIAERRLAALVERSIDIARNHMGNISCPGIIYARGGDAISGEIHEELAETNALHAVPAVKHLFRCELAAIKALRAAFGKVHVISIPGNHGRVSLKKKSKGYTGNNFETLLAWWLESVFTGDASVTFDTPESGDAYFPVYDYRVLMSHGDRMGSSGGQGFIGPAATIIRGHRKLFDQFNRTGRPIDYILTGHFHTSLKLSHGFANGSLAGYSEYARDLRADPAPPTQWLLFFHQRRGVGAQWEITLENNPRADMARSASAWWEGAPPPKKKAA